MSGTNTITESVHLFWLDRRFFFEVKLRLTSAVQPVQVNCCARLVQRTPDSQKGACCAAPTSPGISGGAHSPEKQGGELSIFNREEAAWS